MILVSEEIYFVFQFHENMKILTGLKLDAMAIVTAWISGEPIDRAD